MSLNDPNVDLETVAGVYMEAITFAKNEAYSREVAFHTRKGCRANVQSRDPQKGWCYKNGGQPLWGYRAEQVHVGTDRRGRAMVKSIWVPDATMIAGKPLREWVRHCLVELAAKGATLDQLRDFCHETGLPARRNEYWSSSTWNSLLQPGALLKYCGFEVWNVHRKNGSQRPASEWVIVENAHEALISEEEARQIAEVRGTSGTANRFDAGKRRSLSSPFLLSGGLLKCARCGSNMIGYTSGSRRYYVCGSMSYRRGLGCGKGVYVPQDWLEDNVISGLGGLLATCGSNRALMRRVNAKLRRMWQEGTGSDPQAQEKLKAVEGKIENIRRAVEEGLGDALWANDRLAGLKAEREQLLATATLSGEAPQIDEREARAYAAQTRKILSQGNHRERKQMLRCWVQEMRLAPDELTVHARYQLPEPVVVNLVAGAGFEPATFRL